MKHTYPFFKHLAYNHIFPAQLAFGVFFLNLFGNRKRLKALMSDLEYYPEGTLGKELWLLMKQKNLEFVPWYERHDLKHILLGYPQHAPDEIRMQAFMFGNAGFSFVHTLIFLAFVVWTPEVWPELPYHYRVGQLTAPIGDWRLEEVVDKDLSALRNDIGLEAARRQAAEEWMRVFTGSPAMP